MSGSVSLASTKVRHDANRLRPLRRTESDRDLAYLIRTLLRFSAQRERRLSSPTNGFHDAANSVATVVATRALPARWAPWFSAVFNFGAFFVVGTAVANTVAKVVKHDRRASLSSSPH